MFASTEGERTGSIDGLLVDALCPRSTILMIPWPPGVAMAQFNLWVHRDRWERGGAE